MRITTRYLLALLAQLPLSVALADTPLGWINSANSSAYTTTQGEFEVALAAQAVNDSLDVFNYRDDLIAASGRLVGDSGDFSGTKLELHYGITQDISAFYRRSSHSLTIELGEISSVDPIDIDSSLDTESESAGFKWTFFRSNLLNTDNRYSSASLELTAFRSESEDFDLLLDEIRLTNLSVFFATPQTFSVADLEDKGWKSRLLYSWPFADTATATVWLGYGSAEASSGTTSSIESATFRSFFEQSFETDESYLYLGASLNGNVSPRLSYSVNYEYISVTDSKFERFPATPIGQLPGFLSGDSLASADDNHSLNARLAYWLTPAINLSLTGTLYANQFSGILPHYNNPLSGAFSSTAYGFAGLELLYKFP